MRELMLQHLESLDIESLYLKAEALGLKLSPSLDRLFVIEELLEGLCCPDVKDTYRRARKKGAGAAKKQSIEYDEEQYDEMEEYVEPEIIHEFPAPAKIPKRYNQTYIETLIRDPLWVFVFWEVKESDMGAFAKMPEFQGFVLRVVTASKEYLFSVEVSPTDSSWYLNFQSKSGALRVELCAVLGDAPVAIAISQPFVLPPFLAKNCSARFATLVEHVSHNTASVNLDDANSRSNNASCLTQLSGYDELQTLRNTDRILRAPHRFNEQQ
jgi:hypothetical protein